MAEEKIAILIEAEGLSKIEAQVKATAATIKTVVNDLKGVGTAASDAGTSAGLSKITNDLKALEAQVKATAKAMGALAEHGGSKVSTANISESIRAQNEAYKELAASLAAKNTLAEATSKAVKASNNEALGSDRERAAALDRQNKAYNEINEQRKRFNAESRASDIQASKSIEQKGKIEVAAIKQTAVEYAKINALRIQGNKEAFADSDKASAAKLVENMRIAAAQTKEIAKAQAEAAKQAKQASQETKNYGSALSEVGSFVQKAFASYLVYEFLSTLKDATSAVLNWMGNMETYGIAIAASLQVGGKYVDALTGKAIGNSAAFDLARKDAVGVIESLQVANFQTVATLDQLIRMYQEALPIAMKKGFNKKMVEEFTLSVTQAASAMGVSMDMMAEEARSLLTGAINMRNSRVAVALGITPEDVRQNSASADQLFSFLMGKLQVYRTAGEALQDSWRGLWSNFKDVMMQAGGKALEPLFEGIKQHLKETIDSIVTLDKVAGKIIWNPEFLESINAIRDVIKDAWYYATLLKEVGSAGVGAAQAVSKSVGGSESVGVIDIAMGFTKLMMNPFGFLTDLIKSGVSGGFSFEPIKEYFKDRQTSAGKFQANRTVLESGLSEREIADIHIKNAAEKYGIPVEDLAGIAFAENNFRNTMSEKDKDGKRAYGYMQLRERTANDYGIDLSNIMDPQTNIEGGAKHYKMLLDRYNGDREKAMESYNKGQGFMENFNAGKYSDPNVQYKVYGKTQSADELKTNAAEAEVYYRKAAGFADEARKSQYYGKATPEEKRIKVEFETNVGMTEANQKASQDAYKKLIAEAEVLHTKEIKEAQNAGDNLKQNFKNQSLSMEELKENEVKVDEATLAQKIAADEKYLKSYQFFTDEMNGLRDKEGKGIYTTYEEKTNAEEKAAKDIAKIQQDIVDRRTQLGTADALETQRTNEVARAATLEESKEKLGVAQFEYDNLKKINDLKLSLNQITPTEAFESEYASRMKVLEAQKESIELEQAQNKGGTNRITLTQQLAKVNEELNDTERKKAELTVANLKTFEIKQKQLESLVTAEIDYSRVVGDPNTTDQLTYKLELSRLLAAAYLAEASTQSALAKEYLKTAAALKELNTGPEWFVGFKTAMRDTTNEIGSNVKQWTELFKGVFSGIQSSLSSGFVDLWKGNINLGKSDDLNNVQNKIAWNDAEKEKLTLQREDIQNNKELTDAERTQITKAIDLKLKELDANKQLLEKQREAIENSKSGAELFQGFLDKLTDKIADFLASSVIMEFLAFLSGKPFGNSAVGTLFGLGTLAVQGADGTGGGGGGSGIAGSAGGLVVNKGLGYVWDKTAEYLAETAIGKEVAAYYASLKESLGITSSSTPSTIPAGTTGMDYVNTMGGNTPYSGVSYGAAPASEYGSLAMEGIGSGAAPAASAAPATAASTYGSLAMEGITEGGTIGVAEGSSSALGAIAPYIPWIGWLYGVYQVWEKASEMTVNDERLAKQRVAEGAGNLAGLSGRGPWADPNVGLAFAGERSKLGVSTGEGDFVGNGEMRMLNESSSIKDKMEFVSGYIQQMREYGKEAKLTQDEITQLITKALGPQNKELGRAAELMNRMSVSTMDMNGKIVTTTENMAAMKDILAGMDQVTLEALPNLTSYGSILKDMGVTYETYNSQVIDAALLTADLTAAFGLLDGGLSNVELGPFNALLGVMKGAIEQNGVSILNLIPGLERFEVILAQLGININNLPTNRTISINTHVTGAGAGAGTGPDGMPLPWTTPESFHKGGFVGRFHKGGFLKYHPWGGGIGRDEVPIIAQKGEYVLSKKDVDFINKVKSTGHTVINNINVKSGGGASASGPPILVPLGVTVMVDNQSSALLQASASGRQSKDEQQYIIDVVMNNINSRGALGGWR